MNGSQMQLSEYLRRDMELSRARAVIDECRSSIERMKTQKSPQAWALKSFETLLERAQGLPYELAEWRDAAPDAPPKQEPWP